ncbi:MAG: hypothetical protein K0R84_2050 [Clostridia bacterium]|jgi:uncharacterized membrane protein YesL|nr:hypothetical protein [Clostridia bacterium]
MSGIFDIEVRFFRFVIKLMNLVLLNVLWVIFSIPIITMGAATSAVYYVTLKMAADEEGYILKSFLKAFKENLRQGIAVEAIFLICGIIIIADIRFFLLSSSMFAYAFAAIFAIGMVVYVFMLIFAFPLMAKFNNSTVGTVRNSVIMSLRHLPTSIALTVLLVIMLYGVYVSVPLMIMFPVIGVSGYAYITSILLRDIFEKYHTER